ncbi:DUF6090 family protein [Robiginitalea sp. IMCC44478]|uniref:DUF6090 family protein n=1 Tax=Robiginitalea sp. IMCC44478 TaxID=3459122 RepID=UPI004041F6D1
MIPVLRNFRRQLMNNNQLSKYFLYAIGEILLVVIGILIALQVNNWNEQRVREQEALRVMQDLAASIENRFDSYGFLLDPYLNRDSIQNYILDKNIPEVAGPSRVTNPLSFVDFTGFYWDESIQAILDQERIFPERYKKVLQRIRTLKSIRDAFLVTGASKLEALEQQNLEDLAEYNWLFEVDSTAWEARKSFYYTNTAYRNRLQIFRRYQHDFSGQTARFQMLQILIWAELKQINEGKGFAELIPDLENFGLKQSLLMPCDAPGNPTDSIHPFLFWNLVYNSTEEPREIYWNFEAENIAGINILAPGEVLIRSAPAENRWVMVGKDSTCLAKYRTLLDGFVIIE